MRPFSEDETILEYRGFKRDRLSEDMVQRLRRIAHKCRGDILKMTTLARSGHPGGSMSSIDIYLTLYSFARVDPQDPYNPDRDRIVISHGHTSPGVYAALGRLGFFDIDEVIATFRLAGSRFEGHVERCVPGVEWSTGNLGQGLSAGCGFALAARMLKKDWHVFVVMGDGEQQKGQISEARRFAIKFSLTNLTALVDLNGLQISGPIHTVMPQDIAAEYAADGWEVVEIDGHDFQQIYSALHRAVHISKRPVVIIARTHMGQGVSFMRDQRRYHGTPLSEDLYSKAMEELGLEDDLEVYRSMRRTFTPKGSHLPPLEEVNIEPGEPILYESDTRIDSRTAWGQALKSIAELNATRPDSTPIAVFDCDLVESVKTAAFAEVCGEWFFQGGIQEHNTATVAGALSTQGVLTFFSDFSVFGVVEVYNQQRLNDINFTNLKLVCTHMGIDIGKDGKTHHCIDYLGLLNNLYGFRVIIPADPNQTDRVIRYIVTQPGNYFVGMGRSRTPVILTEEGRPFFGLDYRFEYGKVDRIREGNQVAILTMGPMVHRAIRAWEILREKEIKALVLNVTCPKDIPVDVVREAAESGLIITYEDHNIRTGLGSCVANIIAENAIPAKLIKLGIPGYASSGSPDDLYAEAGLSVQHLVETVERTLKG